MESGDPGALVRSFARVVFGALASGIRVLTLETRVQIADGLALIAFELLAPAGVSDAEIALLDEFR